MTLASILAVGLGGAIGALLRTVGRPLIQRHFKGTFFWGTFLVNMAACLIGGMLIRINLADPLRAALVTGFLGGLSTLSTFNVEVLGYALARKWGMSAFYLFVTYAAGIACVAVAFMATDSVLSAFNF